MSGTIVVGGGIAGLTIAWELARRGADVTLLEQERIGAGASGRNTGTLLHQVEPETRQLIPQHPGGLGAARRCWRSPRPSMRSCSMAP